MIGFAGFAFGFGVILTIAGIVRRRRGGTASRATAETWIGVGLAVLGIAVLVVALISS